MTKYLFFILLAFSSTIVLPQAGDKDSRLLELIDRYGQAEVTVPFTNAKDLNDISSRFSVSYVRNGIISIRLSQLTAGRFIDRKSAYTIVEPRELKGLISSPDLKQAYEWDSYPTYTQYVDIMKGFAAQYPSLCLLDTIGMTNNGKLVLVLKISGHVNIYEKEPKVFYSSTIHGDEPGGFILMLHLADYLLKNYASNELVKELADNLEIWINPLANPDGAYRNSNLLNNPIRFNALGYDLNRNFPDPSTPYNSRNVRQKETTDMAAFLEKHRFSISANFHSGDEVVNYPWDSWDENDHWKSKYHADDAWFYNISRAYADTVHRYSSPVYMSEFNNGITRGFEWYVIKGGRQDFVTWQLQGREVTIELDRNFITPVTALNSLWENNYRSLLRYLENAILGIHGIVIDSETSDPVAARVFVEQHDKDSSHVFSDTLSGRFVRMLNPGDWDLTFSAKGYRDTAISVSLGLRERKEMKVIMKRNVAITDQALLYPNPAHGTLKAILPSGFSGITEISIYNITGLNMADYKIIVIERAAVNINVSRFAPGEYVVFFKNANTGKNVRAKFIVIR